VLHHFRAYDIRIGGVYHVCCVHNICVFFLRIRVRWCLSASVWNHRFEDTGIVSIDFGALSCNARVPNLCVACCAEKGTATVQVSHSTLSRPFQVAMEQI